MLSFLLVNHLFVSYPLVIGRNKLVLKQSMRILMHIDTNGPTGARICMNISFMSRRVIFIFKECSFDYVLINIRMIGLKICLSHLVSFCLTQLTSFFLCEFREYPHS